MLLRYITLFTFFFIFSSCSRLSKNNIFRNSRLLSPPPVRQIDQEMFEDDELDLPYFLVHFHRVANGVVLKGKNRGFIDIPVWRRERDNKPYNARVMENILSLAYFYANNRPWNHYYNRLELRIRLEAALKYWCDMQSPEGKFSEYGPGEWNLAATAFATKFMGEALHWLEKEPVIEEELLKRVIETDRKAIYQVLTHEEWYEFGKNYSNQYSNVWAGALAYLDLYPDREIDSLLKYRLRQSMNDFQSKAGYFYEAGVPDWSYNLGTHQSNLHMAFHYAKDKLIRERLGAKARAFSEWLAYNSVPEPEPDVYMLNRGIECRQLLPAFERYGWFLSQSMPLAQVDQLSHAFVLDQQEVEQAVQNTREEVRQTWPRVDPLPVREFSAFSPYTFLHRRHERYYPTPQERMIAMKQLPVNRKPFVHQRFDTRNHTVYTYVRTEQYYAAFNSGKQLRRQQRYGLGLVWNPETGTVLQTQTGDTTAAWGMRTQAENLPVEADDLPVHFFMDDQPVSLQAGNHDLSGEVLSLIYDLESEGTKQVEFLQDRIRVSIAYPGTFYEFVPLLVPDDKLLLMQSNKVILPEIHGDATVTFENNTPPEIIPTQIEIGDKKIICLKFKSEHELVYEVGF